MDRRDRYRLAVLDNLKEALRVEIDAEMKRRQIRLCDVRRAMEWSTTRRDNFSAFLRGDLDDFGFVAALGVAEKLRISVRIDVGSRQVAA